MVTWAVGRHESQSCWQTSYLRLVVWACLIPASDASCVETQHLWFVSLVDVVKGWCFWGLDWDFSLAKMLSSWVTPCKPCFVISWIWFKIASVFICSFCTCFFYTNIWVFSISSACWKVLFSSDPCFCPHGVFRKISNIRFLYALGERLKNDVWMKRKSTGRNVWVRYQERDLLFRKKYIISLGSLKTSHSSQQLIN